MELNPVIFYKCRNNQAYRRVLKQRGHRLEF